MAASVFSVSTSDSPLETLEPGGGDRDGVGAQPLGGDLETGAGARGGLEEQVDDHLPAQHVQPLEGVVLEGLEVLGAVQDGLDLGALQTLDPQQSRRHNFAQDTFSTSSDFLDLVDFLELHFDDLVVGGLHGAADEARLDGQLAVAPVDQHQQLHAGRAAVIEQRVQGGPDGAAGVEDVVHQDDVLAGDRKRDVRGVHHGLVGNGGQVVAVQGDIQDADRDVAVLQGLDLGRPAAGPWARRGGGCR